MAAAPQEGTARAVHRRHEQPVPPADPAAPASDAEGRGDAGDEIEVTVNGSSRSLPAGSTVADLLASLGHTSGPVAVEIDHRIVPRSNHATNVLRAGDAVEVVGFVGGG